jgi:hypothetical protein
MAFCCWENIMKLKKNIRHPNFIIGLLSFFLFLLGVVLRGNDYVKGNMVILSAIILGAVHWIWSIVNVVTGYDLKPGSKVFWLIVVMLIPPVGGMLYYMMERKNVSM